MTSPTDEPRTAWSDAPGPRGTRAVAVGLAVAVCAVLAHVLGGGTVGALPVVVVAAAATATAWCLAGRRLDVAPLLGLLLLGQVGLHVLAPPSTHDGVAMAAAHLGATALSLLLVRDGEEAWRRLADVVLPRPVVPQGVPGVGSPEVSRALPAPTPARVVGNARGRAPPVAA